MNDKQAVVNEEYQRSIRWRAILAKRAVAVAIDNAMNTVLENNENMKGSKLLLPQMSQHQIHAGQKLEAVQLFKDGIGIKITVEIDHLPEGVNV